MYKFKFIFICTVIAVLTLATITFSGTPPSETSKGKNNMQADSLSLSTTPVFLMKDNTVVSQGTGFYYLRQTEKVQTLFLVTNYHVLTGSSPNEHKPPIGNNISFQFHTSDIDPSHVKIVRLPLFTKENKPIWKMSLESQEADLAVIPIPTILYEGTKISCISEEWARTNLNVHPTSRATLIGYPYGYYDKKNSLPIWKTGSIASEPHFNFDGNPYFLIDVSAFPGMSGSPVFAISYGTYETEDGNTTVGSAKKFLGIYASMQMLNEKKYLEELVQSQNFGISLSQSLQLGHVWKAELIVDVINSIDVEKYSKEILQKLQ